MASIEELAAAVKAQGETVRALKAAKKPKDDPELVGAIKKLGDLKKELDEANKPIETNPFVKTRAELDDVALRRFFYRQAFAIYGGTAGFYTYGPPGAALKNNIIAAWRRHFIVEENLLEIEDPTIMPHDVLKTSGHVERFNDFMVKDTKHEDKFFRADKLLEEEMENRLKLPATSAEDRVKYTKDLTAADSFSKEELGAKLKEYGIKAPETGNDLTDPYEFNLMFPTPIGPSGMLQGYLRPETAQGIFLNYKFCAEQNNEKMPFGVAQIGKSYRNEIAPRGGLVRQREFSQAEIEFFVKPGDKKFPKFSTVRDISIPMLSSPVQLEGKPVFHKTLGKAVDDGTIANETLGYFIGRVFLFLQSVGVKKEHMRFRQHLPTEMAHYACDCWDCEIEVSTGWMETVGIADRSAFDLTVHAEKTKVDLYAQEKLDVPEKVEVVALAKKAGALLGKDLKKDGATVKAHLEGLSAADAKALEAKVKEAGSLEIDTPGGKFTVTKDHVVFDIKMETKTTRNYVPNVIEPSFGIDRIFTAVLEHCYYARPSDEETKKDEKITRGVLGFRPEVAPYKAIVMPLDQRVSATEKYQEMEAELRKGFSYRGINYKVDDSGATIGKRYARNDELGVPLAITIDFDSVGMGEGGDAGLVDTVTLRERDTLTQVRMPVGDVAETVARIMMMQQTWAEVQALY
eukprot:CAMPEP_0173388684 /NCGR_PEP_ID=MMETSP1356-20130122/10933_1 /TAXON_ID=77927 ORGANISM="Hemiselmis virescens, Strain PCC157" /NCGR_SAMPLE_ID=MMETSP1356 /ASSEMBLY_ACC=CAM_ASM_000847 /LENGTH=686 /DNA_ID=CAMNT_0014345649 /DNA_START=34 /DNA_END=2091 /DNA_ORIENTATION=-